MQDSNTMSIIVSGQVYVLVIARFACIEGNGWNNDFCVHGREGVK